MFTKDFKPKRKKVISFWLLTLFFYFLIFPHKINAVDCEVNNQRGVCRQYTRNFQNQNDYYCKDNDGNAVPNETGYQSDQCRVWPLQACCVKKNNSCLRDLEECDPNHPEDCCSGICSQPIVGKPRCSYNSPPPSASPQAIQPKFCWIAVGPGGPATPPIQGIETTIGCLPTDPQKLLEKFLPWFMGLAGGIAFFLMLAGAFTILTSAGNPEKVKVGQERLTSAIIGLLFIIFSVFLIRIIGLPIMEISKNTP